MSVEADVWEDCYETGWKGWITPDSFSHPAKFSRSLIERIYDHAFEMGWITVGDTVLDPFAGVALGALSAMGMGLNWVGVELEQKFVDLGEQNILMWNCMLNDLPNLGTARMINGDSRYLKAVIEGVDLVLSSPPYSEIRQDGGRIAKEGKGGFRPYSAEAPDTWFTQRDQRNLGNLREGSFDTCVSSPPYESDSGHPSLGSVNKDNWGKEGKDIVSRRNLNPSYGNSNQLGSGDTFWSASKEIVQQCYDLLKPDGHAIWVCKDYVKAKKRVPFSDRWLALCESVGFRLVCRHQASLVKYTVDENGIVTTKERKSFFRRLAESKGSPRIDWEDILCLEK